MHISSTQQAKAGQPPGKNLLPISNAIIAKWGHPGATKPTPTGQKDVHTATDGYRLAVGAYKVYDSERGKQVGFKRSFEAGKCGLLADREGEFVPGGWT